MKFNKYIDQYKQSLTNSLGLYFQRYLYDNDINLIFLPN